MFHTSMHACSLLLPASTCTYTIYLCMNAFLLCFISEVEEILQDLKADDDSPHREPLGDIQELESMINDRYNIRVYADPL